MSKAIHPITKLAERLVEKWPDYAVHQLPFAEKEIARHVKPLLDALWADHEICREGVEKHGDEPTCKTCRLLAAWRAKL